MGAKSRNKGKVGERELAGKFTDAGFPATRGQQHRGGPGSPDVIVESLPFLHIECKRTQALRLYEALDQAARDAGEGQMPVVCHRRNNSRWIAILGLDDLIRLTSEYDAMSPAEIPAADVVAVRDFLRNELRGYMPSSELYPAEAVMRAAAERLLARLEAK